MLAPNSTLQNGRYRIVRRIGQGGMGAVYEAYDVRLNNQVAIKEALVYDPELLRAFEKEAQRLARLRHSALPNVIDHFTEKNGGQYLVMEFIKGQDLRGLQRERAQPFPVEQVLAWGEQLLDALAYLHERGVIHRDIKPANLKLTPEEKIILLDFGLAKGGLTIKSQSVKGYTPGFAPPEQMTEKTTDERSDLYSLGATLYTLLTNATPAHSFKRIGAESQGKPDPLRPANQLNPQVPPHIAAILTRAMALEPNERPTSAKEMLARLSPTISPRPMRPPTRADKLSKPVKPSTGSRHGSKLTCLPYGFGCVGAVLFLLVVIVMGLTMMLGRGSTTDLPSTSTGAALPPSPTATSNPRATPAALGGTPLPESLTVISDENASGLREIARLREGVVSEIAYSPDGELLALGSSFGVYLYNANTLEEIRFLDSQESINIMAFSPDGSLLAAGTRRHNVKLWQVSNGQLLATLEGHTKDVNSVSFSLDGEQLASGSNDETVRLWRVSDRQLLSTLEEHTDDVTSVSFSPDGERLASGSKDDRVRLWRMSDGQLLAILEGHTGNVTSVSFSPDGERLASGSDDDAVRLWRASDGQLLSSLEAHTLNVSSVSFSPDGKLLASGSDDETVRLWRASDGQLLATLEGHTFNVNSVSFSPDGRLLASASNSTIRLWGVVE